MHAYSPVNCSFSKFLDLSGNTWLEFDDIIVFLNNQFCPFCTRVRGRRPVQGCWSQFKGV